MLRTGNKKAQATAEAGQAAVELAVFGAILIFLIGTIVRAAVSNGYAQNQNFKAMRMAMLASWQGTEPPNPQGFQAQANTSHNSASVLFVQDRLSPDFNKYGDLDRTPYVAQGSGTFSYNLFYPWQPGQDNPASMLPIMDIWVNGQHFPFSTASYVVNNTIARPLVCPYAAGSCQQNQCLRNQREWAGGIVSQSQFDYIIPINTTGLTAAQVDALLTGYSSAIFQASIAAGLVGTNGAVGATSGFVVPGFTNVPAGFNITDPTTGQPMAPPLNQQEINGIQSILQGDANQYKLFYTPAVNGAVAPPLFAATPPQTCSGTNNALCASATMVDQFGNPYTNTNGDMQYDLLRNGDYNSGDAAAVETNFPPGGAFRNYVAWQWAATPATNAASIGLDTTSNQYPQYDIDGRLKEVTIYSISQNPDGSPSVSYEDPDGGDIDPLWDTNSCGPKPGLQNNIQMYTFTQAGTYLQILEGNLYDPETSQFVRSANKRDTVDLIDRTIQLSNNTGRFCDGSGNVLGTVGNDGITPNPVEVCVPPGAGYNCFSSETNIKATCYDESDNRIFVRSRIQDLRGHYWMTDTAGQLLVQ